MTKKEIGDSISKLFSDFAEEEAGEFDPQKGIPKKLHKRFVEWLESQF